MTLLGELGGLGSCVTDGMSWGGLCLLGLHCPNVLGQGAKPGGTSPMWDAQGLRHSLVLPLICLSNVSEHRRNQRAQQRLSCVTYSLSKPEKGVNPGTQAVSGGQTFPPRTPGLLPVPLPGFGTGWGGRCGAGSSAPCLLLLL